jgi:hypothetical protein
MLTAAGCGWMDRLAVTGAQNYRGVNLMRVRAGKTVEALGYGERP